MAKFTPEEREERREERKTARKEEQKRWQGLHPELGLILDPLLELDPDVWGPAMRNYDLLLSWKTEINAFIVGLVNDWASKQDNA
jgi:hypothetical protein